jgi:outer membrane receptor protein involved in Fe transport
MWSAWEASLLVHVQGAVARRASDSTDPRFAGYRPAELGAWATLDARVGYRVTDSIVIALVGTNLGDARAALVKNHAAPFDYRSDGLRILMTVDVR